jgi:hypothetical protein
MFKKASKKQVKLRLLIEGASGSGKTYSALTLASGMGGKVAVIDTEKGSASLYSSQFDFDVLELSAPYSPERYIEAIKAAESEGYDVIVVDSISQEWSGAGGCIELQNSLGGRYQDWAKITPRHNKFIESILQSSSHVIATARAKADYAMVQDGNKAKVSKLGTKTEQRDGLDFEFTTVLRLNQNNIFEASKDRTGLFNNQDGVLTAIHAELLVNWLNDGEIDNSAVEKKNKKELSAYMSSKCIGKDNVTNCVAYLVDKGYDVKLSVVDLFSDDMIKQQVFKVVDEYAYTLSKTKGGKGNESNED